MAPPAWTWGAAVRSVSGSVWGDARHSCSGLLCRGAGCPVRRVLPRSPGTSGAARAPSYDALEGRRRRCRPVRRHRRGHVCRRACPWARRAGTSERTGSPHQRVKLGTSTPPTIFFCSTAIFFLFPPDLIPPVARCGRHAAPWFSPHVANRVPPREACPRSRLPSTNPPYTHTTPHYSPHLTPHCSRLYVATFLVQCTRVPSRVNVGLIN